VEAEASAPVDARETPPEPLPEAPEDLVDPRAELERVLRGEGEGMTADRAALGSVRTAPRIDHARALLSQSRAAFARAMYGVIPQMSISGAYHRLTPIENGRLVPAEANDTIAMVGDPAARGLWTAQAERPLPVVLDQWQFLGTVAVPVSDVFLEVLPRWNAAEGIVEARALQLEAEALSVALVGREAFYQYARARGSLAVAQIALRQAELRERQIAAYVSVGYANPADVLRARAQTAAAEGAVARTEGGVEIAAEALRTLLHVDDTDEIAVGEDLLAELPATVGQRSALVAEGRAGRAEARALRKLIEARGREVDAFHGSQLPNVLLTGQVEYSNPNARVFPQTAEFRFSGNVGVMVEWSLHDTLTGGRLADEASALVAQARADLRSLEDAIRIEVTEAHVGFDSARRAYDAARVGAEAADEAYRVRMAQFRTGNVHTTDLVDAALAQVRAQLDLVNAAIDARVALARLKRAIGVDEVVASR
jgi:outer membrane protein TolC